MKFFNRKSKNVKRNTYTFPTEYIYEGTNADGMFVRIMAKSFSEALTVAGGTKSNLELVGEQKGMTMELV